MKKTPGILINGDWLKGEGSTLRSFSPVDGSKVWKGNAASAAEVRAAVTAARKAQPGWAALPLSERVALVERFASLLTERAQALASCISSETGKPLWEAATEVQAMINKAGISIRAQQERSGEKQTEYQRLSHRPHGVMAVFGPYNFPGHLPNGHMIPALLAGNTVVFKPSEETPLTAIRTLEIWLDAGLPRGVINLVQGYREVGEALCAEPIDGLLFTGSSNTGKLLHKQFGGRPEVILALEMGGNNPLIVDAGVDTEIAAQIIVRSAFLSAGQRCTCARRLIMIESEQTDAILKAVRKLTDRLIAGAPDSTPEPFMGPVINPSAARRMLAAQADLEEIGGKVLRELRLLDDFGCLLSPGIIDMTGVKKVPDEEWFGPLLQVYRVKDFDAAMAAANNTSFGLSAGLISDDADVHQRFLQQIRAGVITINQPTVGAASSMPFGGIGASGNHRPSAFYAADYCAWPQAGITGDLTTEQSGFSMTGIRE